MSEAGAAPAAGARRVGIIQSSYIPWRGYFDFIDSVDVFVFYDDVQYSTGSWRNRNQVKTAAGLRWLTVPVRVSLGMAIDEVEIGAPKVPWRETQARLLDEALGGAPHYDDAMALWRGAVSCDDSTISGLNIRLTRSICAYLGINTPCVNAREYGVSGAKTERLVMLLKKLGATHYLSGPSARGYLDEPLLAASGIALEYKSYDYAPYPQQWGNFVGTVSVLDLIANTGPAARSYLKSRTPDSAVTP